MIDFPNFYNGFQIESEEGGLYNKFSAPILNAFSDEGLQNLFFFVRNNFWTSVHSDCQNGISPGVEICNRFRRYVKATTGASSPVFTLNGRQFTFNNNQTYAFDPNEAALVLQWARDNGHSINAATTADFQATGQPNRFLWW